MPANTLRSVGDFIANGPEHFLPALISFLMAGIAEGIAAAAKGSDDGENNIFSTKYGICVIVVCEWYSC